MVFRNGEVLRLEDGGPWLACSNRHVIAQGQLRLASGEVLLRYMSEALNASDEEWGEERMIGGGEELPRAPRGRHD
jgi:hypothetical protein